MSTLGKPGVIRKTHGKRRVQKAQTSGKEFEKFKKPEEIYEEIKHTLRISIVDQPFRLWGENPSLLRFFWNQLKPNLETHYFEAAADRIRENAARLVSSRIPVLSDHQRLLMDSDVSKVTIQKIRFIIDLHHYVNSKILLVLCALAEAFQGYAFEPRRDPRVLKPILDGVPSGMPEIRVLNEANFSDSIREILKDIKKMLALPAIPTDYLCMGLCPGYLELAWTEIRRIMKKTSYRGLAEDLRLRATILARGFPYPIVLGPYLARRTCMSLSEAAAVVLPSYSAWADVTLTLAALKIGLDGEEAALRSPYSVV